MLPPCTHAHVYMHVGSALAQHRSKIHQRSAYTEVVVDDFNMKAWNWLDLGDEQNV